MRALSLSLALPNQGDTSYKNVKKIFWQSNYSNAILNNLKHYKLAGSMILKIKLVNLQKITTQDC